MLLVDTRDPEPEPDGDWAWVARALDWLFPWPAIITFLVVGTLVVPGVVGMVFAILMMVVVAWRVSKMYSGVGGLSDYYQ